MRNKVTDLLGEQVSINWGTYNGTVDSFMDGIKGAFDIKYLCDFDEEDKYASFFTNDNGIVYQFYYWESTDKWFCKE